MKWFLKEIILMSLSCYFPSLKIYILHLQTNKSLFQNLSEKLRISKIFNQNKKPENEKSRQDAIYTEHIAFIM